tara:strand:- start:190 stop:333 length:144 start_codon:yes stop_codon:yes gene_type:complete
MDNIVEGINITSRLHASHSIAAVIALAIPNLNALSVMIIPPFMVVYL